MFVDHMYVNDNRDFVQEEVLLIGACRTVGCASDFQSESRGLESKLGRLGPWGRKKNKKIYN